MKARLNRVSMDQRMEVKVRWHSWHIHRAPHQPSSYSSWFVWNCRRTGRHPSWESRVRCPYKFLGIPLNFSSQFLALTLLESINLSKTLSDLHTPISKQKHTKISSRGTLKLNPSLKNSSNSNNKDWRTNHSRKLITNFNHIFHGQIWIK